MMFITFQITMIYPEATTSSKDALQRNVLRNFCGTAFLGNHSFKEA